MIDSTILLSIQGWLAEYGFRLLGAVAVFVVGRWIASWLTRVARRGMGRSGLDETLINFAASVIYYGLLVVVILAALNLVGVETTSVVAVLGAATLAVGHDVRTFAKSLFQKKNK